MPIRKMIRLLGGPYHDTPRDFTGWDRLPPVLYVPIETDLSELYIDDRIMWREPDAVYSLAHAATGEILYKYERTVDYKPK